jgi:hypothetical protein
MKMFTIVETPKQEFNGEEGLKGPEMPSMIEKQNRRPPCLARTTSGLLPEYQSGQEVNNHDCYG